MTTSRYVDHVMGMPISLALRGRHTDDDPAARAWAGALDILRAADRIFSTYRTDSYISRLNRGELTVADCPPEVAEVLELGERARVESGGAFDVRREHGLDPSGVVKGWAVERAAHAFDQLPDTDYCLSAGGDMTCHVATPDAPAWRIGIEDPHDPDKLAAVVPIRNGAIATSALHRRGDHITDARTGTTPTHAGLGHRHLPDPDPGRHRRHRGLRPGARRTDLAPVPPPAYRPGDPQRRHAATART